MAWDSFKGFETARSKELARQIAEAERILAEGPMSRYYQPGEYSTDKGSWRFDDMGLERGAFTWGGGDPMNMGAGEQIVGAATHNPVYEGQMFGQFAKAAGLTPEQAEEKFNQYITQAGGIENLGLRTKIPIDSLIGEYGSSLPAGATEWWNTTGRNEAEAQAQSWQDMTMAQNKASGGWRRFVGPASVIAPMVIGPLSAALGITTAPAAATMMPAFADAGTAGLGIGAGASASSLGNIVTGLARNPATMKLAGAVLGDSGGDTFQPQRTAFSAPEAQPSLSNSVLSQATQAPSVSAPQSLSNSVMTTSAPQNVVRRPQIRLSPGFRRGQ